MNNIINKKIVAITIIIALGMGITINKASAMTDVQRYFKGYDDIEISLMSMVEKINFMNTAEFHKHSVAYQNGWILGLDMAYGLKLPYYDYDMQRLVNSPD